MKPALFRKPVFDAIRRLLGRRLRQSDVVQIDAAIDRALAGPEREAEPGPPRVIGPGGVALIKQFEGCARRLPGELVEAYPDPASPLARTGAGSGAPWTIGWGATGPGIGPGTVWRQDECDARLARDLERYAAEVARALDDAPTSQAQFDALVSFHYNTGAIARATLTARHNAGDHAGAAEEFARWNRAGGQVLAGLTRRRASEAALYRSEAPCRSGERG